MGNFCIDELSHSLADACHISLRHIVAEHQVAVVAVGHGNVYHHFAVGVEVMDRLAEHEEERAHVATFASSGVEVEKLHVLVVVEAIVELPPCGCLPWH